ncbi:hypothetical protein D5R40_34395, partial [Okeania hirsuta]
VKNTSFDEAVVVSSSTTIVVEVTEEEPEAKCKDITVNLVNGSYSNNSFADLVDDGSTAPVISVLSVSESSFDCDDLGLQTVTLTVIGSHGVSSSCEAGVTVQVDPSEQAIAKCQPTQIMNLMEGRIDISVADIDNGSTFGP